MHPEPTNPDIGADEQACRTCRFYDFYDNRALDELGTCLRHAPQPKLTATEKTKELHYAEWPTVRWNAWCGEWQREPKMDEADAK